MSVTLRAARSTDAGATGEILYRFQAETDWMPKLHSGAETIAFCGVLIGRGWVTVAEDAGRVIGFLARDQEEICALYLAPEATGQGAGKLLLDHAKGQRDRLFLATFLNNSGARRFYEREGFLEAGRGDGSGNEEGLPDITYLWRRDSGPNEKGNKG